MDRSVRDFLISQLPGMEHGRALMDWIQEEISLIEQSEEYGAKICDAPLHEDFRTKLGMKLFAKRVMRKPQECFEQLNKSGG